MDDPLINQLRARVRWWPGRFDLLWKLERPSIDVDPSIQRLPCRTMRQNRDLSRFLAELGILPYDVLAYEARAAGGYGQVRLAALFPLSPFEGHHPEVFALDGLRTSKHRNPPWDGGVEGVSAHLCLYFRRDPTERRWTVDDGLVRLFDLARRHLEAEHIWRRTGVWPIEEAEHGAAAPARPNPRLQLPPLRAAS
jgi:hypothetical protein